MSLLISLIIGLIIVAFVLLQFFGYGGFSHYLGPAGPPRR